MKNIAYLIAALVLTGCANTPAYKRPAVNLPAQWQAETRLIKSSTMPSGPWWYVFADPALDDLMQAALGDNLDLEAALARIDQARAVSRINVAGALPSVFGNVGVTRSKKISDAAAGNQYAAQLGIGFEPDLWGKYAALGRSGEATVTASVETSNATALALTGGVASAYFQTAVLQHRISMQKDGIDAARKIDKIIEARYRHGALSGLDRAQSKANLANIEAGLPLLEQARQQTLHELALLLGRNPENVPVVHPDLIDRAVPQTIPEALPSELLLRRPDIRQAEASLKAAHADIAVARANLFPSLLLTAQGGAASTQLAELLGSPAAVFGIGLNLLAPLFQGGRLEAGVALNQARYRELLANYRIVILGALRDVENALAAFEAAQTQETFQRTRSIEAERAFTLSRIRYEAGQVDTLTLLISLRVWLDAKDAVLQVRLSSLNALVSLHLAVGGDLMASRPALTK